MNLFFIDQKIKTLISFFVFQIKSVLACEKQVHAINLEPHNTNKLALTLYTLHKNYFYKMETRELKETLLNVLKCDLYKGNS